MVIASETPVRDIVLELPTTIPVLEHFGIDYCCDGTQTLSEACDKRELLLAQVMEELQRQQRNKITSDSRWQTASLKELTEYIVQKHHAFTRLQLELLRELAAKVAVMETGIRKYSR